MDRTHGTDDPTDEILRLSPDDAAGFVAHRIRTKSLGSLMTALNRDVLSADPQRRSRARQALRRLGFDGSP